MAGWKKILEGVIFPRWAWAPHGWTEDGGATPWLGAAAGVPQLAPPRWWGASLTSDHAVGRRGWSGDPNPALQVGRHLPSGPLLLCGFWAAFYPVTPHLVKSRVCFLQPDTSARELPLHGRRVHSSWGCPPEGHLRGPAVSVFAGGTRRHESGHRARLDCVGWTISVYIPWSGFLHGH